jgi:hypothetical protein
LRELWKNKRTRQQLFDDWPADFPAPADTTLARWLKRAVALDLVRQEGTGRKNDPFRYWLPEQEAKWKEDPMYEIHQLIREANKQVHVCPIFDVGEHDGQPFVVMAYLEGRSLAEWLADQGRFDDLGHAVILVRQVRNSHSRFYKFLRPGTHDRRRLGGTKHRGFTC